VINTHLESRLEIRLKAARLNFECWKTETSTLSLQPRLTHAKSDLNSTHFCDLVQIILARCTPSPSSAVPRCWSHAHPPEPRCLGDSAPRIQNPSSPSPNHGPHSTLLPVLEFRLLGRAGNRAVASTVPPSLAFYPSFTQSLTLSPLCVWLAWGWV